MLGPCPDAGRRERAGQSDRAVGLARAARDDACSTPPATACAPSSSVRVSSTAGRAGIVGDLLRDAANSLVRVIGTGDNHWPLVYERDLGELYVRLAATPGASGIYHANDEGDERVNDLVAAIGEHVKTTPSVRRVPLAEAQQEDGRLRRRARARPDRPQPARAGLGWNPSLHSVAGNAARLVDCRLRRFDKR